MVSAETRRRRPRSRRIARPAGSPCMRATVKVSARVEHVVLPDLVETANSYTKCVFCSERSQCGQGLRFARIFTFHPGGRLQRLHWLQTWGSRRAWTGAAPMRRRQPGPRHIARRAGAPCKPATDEGSVRHEHVRSPVLVASAQIIDLMCNL